MSIKGLSMKTSTGLLISMMIFTVAGLLQGLVCVRYIDRISDDRPVIMLCAAAVVLYAAGAVFFYRRWIKERGKEAG
jgi:hypothetical protein